ncbi:MAG TPA: hypothetical protein VN922_09035 [Bacteroidia bacterium]|nr:hypothetical protein [Bacteroidia bacterium]
MENKTRTIIIIIIATIISYLGFIVQVDRMQLPMVISLFMTLTDVKDAGMSLSSFLALIPIIAILVLVLSTFTIIIRKDMFYGVGVLMLYPSAWAALRDNMDTYGKGLITLSELPFFIISGIGLLYITWNWIKWFRNREPL